MEVQLDLIKMGARRLFSDVFVNEARFDMLRREIDNMHEMFVTGKLYGEAHFQEYRFKYPADWWQAVKERFAPAWFLRRYPVIYTHQIISIDVLYPELSKRLKLPNEQHKLILSGYSEKDTD